MQLGHNINKFCDKHCIDVHVQGKRKYKQDVDHKTFQQVGGAIEQANRAARAIAESAKSVSTC